jgi:dipeptide/tripeptide permease
MFIDRLPSGLQGLLYMAAGLIIVLYALGLVQKGISFAIIMVGLFLMTLGYGKSGMGDKVSHMLGRLHKKH